MESSFQNQNNNDDYNSFSKNLKLGGYTEYLSLGGYSFFFRDFGSHLYFIKRVEDKFVNMAWSTRRMEQNTKTKELYVLFVENGIDRVLVFNKNEPPYIIVKDYSRSGIVVTENNQEKKGISKADKAANDKAGNDVLNKCLSKKDMKEIDAIYNSVEEIAKFVSKKFVDDAITLKKYSDNDKVKMYERYKNKFINDSTTSILKRLDKISDEKLRKKALRNLKSVSKNVEKKLK